MPEMPLAARALDLCPRNPKRPVRHLQHILLRDWSPEARPARPRLELRLGLEQRRPAADAPV